MKAIIVKNRILLIEIMASLICGLAIFYLFFGLKSLDFTNDEWIFEHSGDLTEHYLGWRFFRNSRWFLPIGSVEGIAWPDHISIIYLDCIPWMAILFKLASPILPGTFQYMGIYELFCFCMQAFLGMEIVKACTQKHSAKAPLAVSDEESDEAPDRLLEVKTAAVIILGGVLLSVSAPMINRVFYHTALSGHFLFLWALLLWIKNDELEDDKRCISWAILGAACTLTHLFFVPIIGLMLIGLAVMDLLRGRNGFRLQLKLSAVDIAFYVLGAFVLFITLGGFDNTFNPTGAGAGFYGANLNSLINPMGYSAFLPTLPMATDGQYEGFGYLGLGWIILAITALIVLIIRYRGKRRKVYGAFAGFCFLYVISFAAAAGSIVGINENVILNPAYPYPLDLLLNIFRSHGRFTWALVYVIPVLSIIIICALLDDKRQIIVIFAAIVVIQIADFSPHFNEGEDWYEGYDPYMENTGAWEKIADTGGTDSYVGWNIMFLPDGLDYSQHNKLFEIADLAADHGMTLDNYYYARPREDYVRQRQQVIKNNLDLGYEYENLLVVFDDVFEPMYHNWKLHYYNVNNIVIGTGRSIEGLNEIDYSCGIPVDITLKRNIEYGEKLKDGSVLLDFTGSISGPEWRLNAGHYRYTINCEDPEHTALLYNSNVDDGYIENITSKVSGGNIIEYEFDVPQDALGMTLFIRNDSEESRHFYSTLLTKM